MAKKRKKKTARQPTRAKRISVSAVAVLAEKTASELKNALDLNAKGKLANSQAELDQMDKAQRFLNDLVSEMQTKANNFEICPQIYEIDPRPVRDSIVRKKHSQ